MMFQNSFLRLILIVATLILIYINDYNQVEACVIQTTNTTTTTTNRTTSSTNQTQSTSILTTTTTARKSTTTARKSTTTARTSTTTARTSTTTARTSTTTARTSTSTVKPEYPYSLNQNCTIRNNPGPDSNTVLNLSIPVPGKFIQSINNFFFVIGFILIKLFKIFRSKYFCSSV